MGASLALASIGLLVGPLQGAEAATPKIKVHYIDVGQGDAIYIKMPSGDPHPSREDIEVTERLVEVGRIVGIQLLDHIIVGAGEEYVSLKAQGVL